MRFLPVGLFTVALTISATAPCQKPAFGITVGASLANMHYKVSGFSVSGDSKIGGTAGMFTDFGISRNFSLQPALNFVQKGAKAEDGTDESKLTLNYIEVPLNLLLKPEMKKIHLFLGAGPSIAYAFSGKEIEKHNGVKTTYKYKFGNKPDKHDLDAFDFGANFLTGFQTPGGFMVALNYNLGFSNLAPGSSSSDGKIKSKYFAVRVGYLLKRT
jgi:hypothetical protein